MHFKRCIWLWCTAANILQRSLGRAGVLVGPVSVCAESYLDKEVESLCSLCFVQICRDSNVKQWLLDFLLQYSVVAAFAFLLLALFGFSCSSTLH